MLLDRYNSSFLLVRIYCFLKDVLFSVIARISKQKKPSEINFSRILLNNGAHFGDVLLTLRLVSYIKKAHPNAKIGMIIGSWTLSMVRDCKDIDAVYIVDHWKLNRSKKSIVEKIKQYITTRKTALTQIKGDGYTLAIDFFSRYPTTALLFFQSDIPCRVGYTSGGGAPLLTHPLEWYEEDRHIVEYQADLLREIGIPVQALEKSTVNFRYAKKDEELFREYGLSAGEYIVCHIGSGEPTREWQKEKWVQLAQELIYHTNKIVFTGAGKREEDDIRWILHAIDSYHALSLCGKLSVCDLIRVIKAAKLFVGCESFAGHIAAMCKTPQISIMHGATRLSQWQPFGNPRCIVVRASLSCISCGAPAQCNLHHKCMEDIQVSDVLQAHREIAKKLIEI